MNPTDHPHGHQRHDAESDAQALEQAAEWFALLRSGEATTADRNAWQAWHQSADAHRIAWTQVEHIGRRFQPIQSAPRPLDAVSAYRNAGVNTGRRRIVLGLATAAGTGLAGWMAWRRFPLADMVLAWRAEHRTAIGEVREVVLSDGTRVQMGTASAFDDHFSSDLRRLQLYTGEILISTGSDTKRPFVVDTPHGRLEALGTRFVVRLDEDDTRLAVYDGAVQARSANGVILIVRAGQQTRMTAHGVAPIEAADPARESAVRGIYIAQNVPLEDVVRELGRYRVGHIGVSPDVANLRVFGSYPMTDPDRTLAMLESVMPIKVRRSLPWWISVVARTEH